MRSKQELIRKFIDGTLPQINDIEGIPREFARYWDKEKQLAFEQLCKEEGINPDRLSNIISQFLFAERVPLNEDILGILADKPEVLKMQEIINRVKSKVMALISTFITGAPGGGD